MLYIFDSNEKLATILRNEGEACPYYDAVHTEQINGVNTFQFSCPGDHADAQHVIEGNFVAFRDVDEDFQMFEIVRIEDDRNETGPIKLAFCENVALELLDEVIEDKRPYGVSAQFALMVALEGTRWSVGEVSNLGLNSCNFYYESVLSAIQKILNTWGGEVRFRIRIENNQITGRYVDILDRRGADRGKLFLYGKDLINAKRTIDSSGVKTALYGRGKGEETEDGYGRRITFADVEWKAENGDPVDKPLGQEWVGDPDALAQWGRAGGTRHRFGIFEDPDITDPVELLQKTWEELQRLKEPLVSYEATVADLEQIRINEKYYYDSGLQYDTGLLYYEAIQAIRGFAHEVIRLGDTVRVVDKTFRPALKLQARIIELRRNLTEPEKTEIVLGNFLPLITDEGQRLRKIEAKLNDRSGIWDDKLKPGDKIQTDWLEGIIRVQQNQIEDTAGYVYFDDDGGILILDRPRDDAVNPPTKALLLKGGIFAIANSKNPDGSWKWRTFGDGNGFTADEIRTGTLLASLVNILAGNYVRLDGSGLTVTDPQGKVRVKLGEYEEGKYGQVIESGEIYSTTFQSGGKNATSFVRIGAGFEPIRIIKDGNDALTIWVYDEGGMIQFYDAAAGDMRGQIVPHDDARGEGLRIQARNSTGSFKSLSLQGSDIHFDGDAFFYNRMTVTNPANKNALQETEHYGKRYLYVRESPESKYQDEGIAELVNGYCRVQLDPIFLECIEPNTDNTPWIIHLTPYGDVEPKVIEIGADYFVVADKNGGNGKFFWSLSATTKGNAGRRLEEKK